MAVHRIDQQKDLAALLNWDATKLTKSLRGDRKWALDDLEELAAALHTTPSALLGDTAELVGAVTPLRASGEVRTEGTTNRYSPASSTRLTQSGQVIPFPRSYQTVSTDTTNTPAAVTRMDASWWGRHADTA
jgi:hypothetical protein